MARKSAELGARSSFHFNTEQSRAIFSLFKANPHEVRTSELSSEYFYQAFLEPQAYTVVIEAIKKETARDERPNYLFRLEIYPNGQVFYEGKRGIKSKEIANYLTILAQNSSSER